MWTAGGIVVSCFLAVAYSLAPVMPSEYHVTGLINLPYADIVEPFEAWVDKKNGRSRIDYYGGTAKAINRGDVGDYGAMYQIVYVTTNDYLNKLTCFGVNATATDGQVMYQDVLPNMTDFKMIGSYKYYNVDCDVYQKVEMVGTKKNTYDLLISQQTGAPRLFHFIGYDELFGSHYDEYNILYYTFESKVDPTAFDVFASMSCGSYPGPGLDHVMHANPMFELVGSPDHTTPMQPAHVDRHFDEFKNKHDRDYHDNKEHEERKMHFRHNLRFIESYNRKRLTYSLGVNHLADHSDDEMKIMRGYRPSKGDKGGNMFTSDDVTDVPPSMDWRLYGAVTPIKDQGICGSCWSFGTTGTIEGSYFLKHKNLIAFSEQALVDCSWGYGNNGCDGGETFRAYKWIMDHKCLPTEDGYGQYLQQDGKCHNAGVECGASITNYTEIPSGDLDALRVAVATKGPVAVAIDASLKSFSFYAFGVYFDPECGNTVDDLDHSVLAVGYGTMDGQDYWLVKNSWSNHWGNQGYVLMSQHDNNCGVATDADFATVV